MGISFYYAVRILWRECGREFLTNVHKIKIPKIQKDFGDFAVWTRLELATSCVTGRHSNQLI